MNDINLMNENSIDLDQYKHIDENNCEYYSARELQQLFGYTEWRTFSFKISKAIKISENSSYNKNILFKEVSKRVKAGATYKYIKDYKLNKLALYLLIQECDSSKPSISYFKTYLALNTLINE